MGRSGRRTGALRFCVSLPTVAVPLMQAVLQLRTAAVEPANEVYEVERTPFGWAIVL